LPEVARNDRKPVSKHPRKRASFSPVYRQNLGYIRWKYAFWGCAGVCGRQHRWLRRSRHRAPIRHCEGAQCLPCLNSVCVACLPASIRRNAFGAHVLVVLTRSSPWLCLYVCLFVRRNALRNHVLVVPTPLRCGGCDFVFVFVFVFVSVYLSTHAPVQTLAALWPVPIRPLHVPRPTGLFGWPTTHRPACPRSDCNHTSKGRATPASGTASARQCAVRVLPASSRDSHRPLSATRPSARRSSELTVSLPVVLFGSRPVHASVCLAGIPARPSIVVHQRRQVQSMLPSKGRAIILHAKQDKLYPISDPSRQSATVPRGLSRTLTICI
jgi:hypothetical protein